jgi:hypothetical protein
MKEAARQQFRWAPHVSGVANIKAKDFEAFEEPELSLAVEAENEYAVWAMLRASERPLAVGDVLENSAGQLRICKYVGFEDARWFVPSELIQERAPEPVPGPIAIPPAAQSAQA